MRFFYLICLSLCLCQDFNNSTKDPISTTTTINTNVDIEKLFMEKANETLQEDPDHHAILSGIISSNCTIQNATKCETVARKKRQNPAVFVRGGAGLQSSTNARLIDSASSVGLRVSQTLTNGRQDRVQSLTEFRAPQTFCPFQQVSSCDFSSPFRTVDGSCNNMVNRWWGKSETPYKRYLAPVYADGLNAPRTFSVTGRPLPNPRVISKELCGPNNHTEIFYTHFLAIFGQFLAHDIASTSISADSDGRIVDCPCGSTNPSCLSVSMPFNDFMSCMKFTRSSAAFSSFDCTLGFREQLNLLSSFIDGTQIYGSNEARSIELRSFRNGLLKTSEGANGRPFLMHGSDQSCRDTNERVKCFTAGEGRTNENLGLVSLQTLYLREHNRIAVEIGRRNPTWNDEKIYQEARKLVIASIQHVTYNEFVPLLIGFNMSVDFNLLPQNDDQYFTGYDPRINPSLANEFATAAFRFGHSLIQDKFSRFTNAGRITGQAELKEMTFRTVEAYNTQQGGLESILLGLVSDRPSKCDTHFGNTLQNHLFEIRLSDGSRIAVDLAATNINRGRDHGIPSYNEYRAFCGLPRATSFDDLADTISFDRIQEIARVYENVNDIDLYIGGLSEIPRNGALLGPTFSCLIARQFSDLKLADRFFYENTNLFTINQLREIKKVTQARIICDNTNVQEIQPNVFLQSLRILKNTRVSCSLLPSIDFDAYFS